MGRRSTFTREEKIAAVKLSDAPGRNVTSVANEYGVHPNTIWKWRELYRTNPTSAFTVQTDDSPEGAEMKRMKRRIAELEAENNFLKKVSAYFARTPQ